MKSILEIDAPINCQDCPLSWFDGRDYYCVPNDDIIDDSSKKLDTCPLVETQENDTFSNIEELKRLAEIGKQVEFEEEQGKKYANNIYAKGSHIPNGCYINYGKDLDGCSTQQNEGCSRCSLYRNIVK
jgi:hypothetical protein